MGRFTGNKSSSLNVFGFNPHKSRLKGVPYFFRSFKWAYQRVRYGFCDWDVWALDEYYLKLFAASIEKLRLTTHSYPGTMHGRDEKERMARWNYTLSSIVYHCQRGSINADEFYPNEFASEYFALRRAGETFIEGYAKELRDKYLCRVFEITEQQSQHRQEALELIKKNFNDLWD